MKRILNWDVMLHRWALSVAGRPYVWGETDCGSLVRASHEVMFGVDLFADVASYSSLRAAVERHAATGGIEAAMRAIGAVDVTRGFAQRGDVILEDDGEQFPAAGIVIGRDVLWATEDRGVVMSPLRGRTGLLLRVPNG